MYTKLGLSPPRETQEPTRKEAPQWHHSPRLEEEAATSSSSPPLSPPATKRDDSQYSISPQQLPFGTQLYSPSPTRQSPDRNASPIPESSPVEPSRTQRLLQETARHVREVQLTREQISREFMQEYNSITEDFCNNLAEILDREERTWRHSPHKMAPEDNTEDETTTDTPPRKDIPTKFDVEEVTGPTDSQRRVSHKREVVETTPREIDTTDTVEKHHTPTKEEEGETDVEHKETSEQTTTDEATTKVVTDTTAEDDAAPTSEERKDASNVEDGHAPTTQPVERTQSSPTKTTEEEGESTQPTTDTQKKSLPEESALVDTQPTTTGERPTCASDEKSGKVDPQQDKEEPEREENKETEQEELNEDVLGKVRTMAKQIDRVEVAQGGQPRKKDKNGEEGTITPPQGEDTEHTTTEVTTDPVEENKEKDSLPIQQVQQPVDQPEKNVTPKPRPSASQHPTPTGKGGKRNKNRKKDNKGGSPWKQATGTPEGF
eukprot:TRINITY_DN37370_c0_g1_i1.p1 TRINITY_DN37370_c0_g1~~TRINITY_DN37370_c0_g1_i1.p1  ORF type:complete len:497 (+),score=116.49 TRINITY_DN37370_c0_g1_i1:23-1492(+)